MVFRFGSFLLECDRVIKRFGLGLAVAVLLDATIIRLLLVPATRSTSRARPTASAPESGSWREV